MDRPLRASAEAGTTGCSSPAAARGFPTLRCVSSDNLTAQQPQGTPRKHGSPVDHQINIRLKANVTVATPWRKPHWLDMRTAATNDVM